MKNSRFSSLFDPNLFAKIHTFRTIARLAFVADQIRKRVWDRVSSLGKGYSLPEYLLRMRGIKVHRNSSSWTAENLTAKLVTELERIGVSTDWGERYLVPPAPKKLRSL